MRIDLSALGRKVVDVGLFVIFELFLSATSAGLWTNTSSFVLNDSVLRRHLSKLYFHCFCAAVSQLSVFSLMRASHATRRLRKMGGDMLSEDSGVSAVGKSNAAAAGGSIESIEMNGDTPVDC